MGLTQEHTMDLPITDQATWDVAMALPEIKNLLKNYDGQILDISPDGMKNYATEEEMRLSLKSLI